MAKRRAQGGTDESVMVAYEKAREKMAEKEAEEKSPLIQMKKEEAQILLNEVGTLEEKNMGAVMERFKKLAKSVK